MKVHSLKPITDHFLRTLLMKNPLFINIYRVKKTITFKKLYLHAENNHKTPVDFSCFPFFPKFIKIPNGTHPPTIFYTQKHAHFKTKIIFYYTWIG